MPLTGVGNYTYQIARSLKAVDHKNQYSFFYGYYSKELLAPGKKQGALLHLKESVLRIPLLRTAARNLKDWVNLFRTGKFDLYFEPNFIPLSIPAKRIVATVADFSFAHFPEWHSKEKIQYFQKHFWKKIKRADRIIFISDFIKQEAIQLFGFPPEKLSRIYLGFNQEVFRIYPREDLVSIKNRYSLPENFILFVGSIEPRKNLRNLILAYLELDESLRKEFKLVLVGFKGWKNEEIMSLIQKMKGDIFYIGYVPEEDLGKFYNLARVFVYPSFYEGFGLPPLEAMASGCPVIASLAASLPEVCADAAGYVNPHDVSSIAKGIHQFLTQEELRKEMKTKGLVRAKLFSWEKSAVEHLLVFENVSKF
jgi:glycosyltransferase involved in cell wall biosynthesis